MQVIPCAQRDALYCLHENGCITLRVCRSTALSSEETGKRFLPFTLAPFETSVIALCVSSVGIFIVGLARCLIMLLHGVVGVFIYIYIYITNSLCFSFHSFSFGCTLIQSYFSHHVFTGSNKSALRPLESTMRRLELSKKKKGKVALTNQILS